MKFPDIDIDTNIDFDPESIFNHIIRASRVHEGELLKHPCGFYFQNIPIDDITNLAAIPYQQAEDIGYFKVDFLHLEVYNYFKSRDEIEDLIQQEPDWNILLDKNYVQKLFQVKNHFDILELVKPTTIKELADVLALIRPGKRKLVYDYINDNLSDVELYSKMDDSGYSFKKAHAIAYAHVIVLQLHLIKNGII